VGEEKVRWKSALRVVNELDFHAQKGAQQQSAEVRASTPPRTASRASHSHHRAASGTSHCIKTRNHILVGDLNALARLDYSASEAYFHGRVEHFLHAQREDSWRVMDLFEEQERWVDMYTQAQRARPKITVWSCRRVDHALAYPGCKWTTMFASSIFTPASDHLPQFFVLQPTID
jgi:exonuclease III